MDFLPPSRQKEKMRITQDFSQTDLDNFLMRFLYKFYPRQFYQDGDVVLGELTSTAYNAKKLYKPDMALAKFSTYLTKSLINKMTRFNKVEKEWYTHHISMPLTNFPAHDLPAVLISQYREMVEIITESELPEKSKEIVISFVTKPHKSMKSLGEEFGVTKQRISIVINTARQFLARRNIEI